MREDGGYAFPGRRVYGWKSGSGTEAVPQFEWNSGMSLRDWFAGQALAALVKHTPTMINYPTDPAPLCKQAYSLADALLKARGGE